MGAMPRPNSRVQYKCIYCGLHKPNCTAPRAVHSASKETRKPKHERQVLDGERVSLVETLRLPRIGVASLRDPFRRTIRSHAVGKIGREGRALSSCHMTTQCTCTEHTGCMAPVAAVSPPYVHAGHASNICTPHQSHRDFAAPRTQSRRYDEPACSSWAASTSCLKEFHLT